MLVCIANSFYLLICLQLSCREIIHYIRYQKTIYRGSNLRCYRIIKKLPRCLVGQKEMLVWAQFLPYYTSIKNRWGAAAAASHVTEAQSTENFFHRHSKICFGLPCLLFQCPFLPVMMNNGKGMELASLQRWCFVFSISNSKYIFLTLQCFYRN